MRTIYKINLRVIEKEWEEVDDGKKERCKKKKKKYRRFKNTKCKMNKIKVLQIIHVLLYKMSFTISIYTCTKTMLMLTIIKTSDFVVYSLFLLIMPYPLLSKGLPFVFNNPEEIII